MAARTRTKRSRIANRRRLNAARPIEGRVVPQSPTSPFGAIQRPVLAQQADRSDTQLDPQLH